MKILITLFLSTARYLILCSPVLGVASQEPYQLSDVSWYVQFYKGNHDYIEVTVDATKLNRQYVLRRVIFIVIFLNQKQELIRKETIKFTDDNVRQLEGGSAHRRYFKYESKMAFYVSGEKLICQKWSLGGSFGLAPQFKQAQFDSHPKITSETNLHIAGLKPPLTARAFDGVYQLYVDGIAEDGQLLINYPEAAFRWKERGGNLIDEPLFMKIIDNHIVIKFSESKYKSVPLTKLDGYLSTQTTDSIAGVAWRNKTPVGFHALKLSEEPPKNAFPKHP